MAYIPGVTGDALVPGGLKIDGAIAAGDESIGATGPSYFVFHGNTQCRDTHGSMVDGDDVLDIFQRVAVDAGGSNNALFVDRHGSIASFDYAQAVAVLLDETASAQDVLVISKAAGTGKALNVTGPAAFSGVIGEHGKAPAASPTAITGNVTTGDLAALQAVVGALLTALDDKGSITKSTT